MGWRPSGGGDLRSGWRGPDASHRHRRPGQHGALESDARQGGRVVAKGGRGLVRRQQGLVILSESNVARFDRLSKCRCPSFFGLSALRKDQTVVSSIRWQQLLPQRAISEFCGGGPTDFRTETRCVSGGRSWGAGTGGQWANSGVCAGSEASGVGGGSFGTLGSGFIMARAHVMHRQTHRAPNILEDFPRSHNIWLCL